jgi:hypothetical protein
MVMLTAMKNLALLLLLTALAILVQGYHPGLEDDAFYLAAIKRNLNPALFPHDSDFFRLQFQATIFDKLIAASIRWSHVPLAWGIFLWQFAVTFLILWGCLQISRRCFSQGHAQWAAVAMVAALLTIPVSGTAISLTDQYLHPRALATALILGAIVAVLEERRLLAGTLLALAFAIHAIMASFGISFCIFLGWKGKAWKSEKLHPTQLAILLLPLGWIFEPASPAWRQAAATRHFYHLGEWRWYEWLGVFAPLLLLAFFRWLAQRHRLPLAARLASRLALYGVFQLAAALAIMLPPGLERLRPFEPMRFLHLVYLLMFLLAGGLIGQYILGRHAYRWILLFVPLGLGMLYAQRQMYPSTEHVEWPSATTRNGWVQSFAWIRQNTPVDSLFALDPDYMQLPGEDYHGFRALAERSVLADNGKDAGMAARVPSLAERWQKEVAAQNGWTNFQPSDFQRLKSTFGVNWVLLATPGVPGPGPPGMTCPYRNPQVLVCRVD